jgi:hypothetical protein
MRPHLCLIVSLRRRAAEPRQANESRHPLRALDTQREAKLHSLPDWLETLRAGLRESYRR